MTAHCADSPPHAALQVLLFMPRPSLLFEVFPYRYQKSAYAPLCREYGQYTGTSLGLWPSVSVALRVTSAINDLYIISCCALSGLYYGASMSPAVSPLWKMLLGPVSTEQCMNNRWAVFMI